MKKLLLLFVVSSLFLNGCFLFKSVEEEVVEPDDVLDEAQVEAPSLVDYKFPDDVAVDDDPEVVVSEDGLSASLENYEDQSEIPEATMEEDIQTIKLYYSRIGNAELAAAYAMKIDVKESFAKFTEWYGNTQYAAVSGFDQLDDHTYRFQADLKEGNGAEERYSVTMEVYGDKIKTLSSVKVSLQTVLSETSFNGMRAYIVDEGDFTESLYLTANGVTKALRTVRTQKGPGLLYSKFVGDIMFSGDGSYITYTVQGPSGFWKEVYGVHEGRIISSSIVR